jgi:hypothetical protein
MVKHGLLEQSPVSTPDFETEREVGGAALLATAVGGETAKARPAQTAKRVNDNNATVRSFKPLMRSSQKCSLSGKRAQSHRLISGLAQSLRNELHCALGAKDAPISCQSLDRQ